MERQLTENPRKMVRELRYFHDLVQQHCCLVENEFQDTLDALEKRLVECRPSMAAIAVKGLRQYAQRSNGPAWLQAQLLNMRDSNWSRVEDVFKAVNGMPADEHWLRSTAGQIALLKCVIDNHYSDTHLLFQTVEHLDQLGVLNLHQEHEVHGQPTLGRSIDDKPLWELVFGTLPIFREADLRCSQQLTNELFKNGMDLNLPSPTHRNVYALVFSHVQIRRIDYQVRLLFEHQIPFGPLDYQDWTSKLSKELAYDSNSRFEASMLHDLNGLIVSKMEQQQLAALALSSSSASRSTPRF